MLPRKATWAQTLGHTDTMCSVCTTMTLTTQFLDAPCENICLSFQPLNSEASPHRPGPLLIGASVGKVGRTDGQCLNYVGPPPAKQNKWWLAQSQDPIFCGPWANWFWFSLNYRVILRTDCLSEDLGRKKYIQDKDLGKSFVVMRDPKQFECRIDYRVWI